MMSGGSKLTAMDRIDRARITALANGESFTVEMAARLMEAHAAAAVAEAETRWMLERVKCECSPDDACQFARDRDKAEARVAELEALLRQIDHDFTADHGREYGSPEDQECFLVTLMDLPVRIRSALASQAPKEVRP